MSWHKILKAFGSGLLCCSVLTGTVLLPANAEIGQTADEIVSQMSEREKITQMLMPAFRQWKDSGAGSSLVNVTEMNDELEGVMKDYKFGGVILFAQNLATTDQMVKLTNDLQQANAEGQDIPLLIATDQEGGSVVRLGSGCRMTGNMALGATNDEQAAYDTGEIMGSELESVGINVDFAPVMDTNDNSKNPVIGLRSFSDDPNLVAKLGVKMIEGIHQHNVATALKHFPGHGNTSTDSHTTMPIVYKTMDELKKVELVPFQAGIDAGTDMIMTTHIEYPNIISEELPTKNKDQNGNPIMMKPPATLSKEILTDLMRDQMHYEGVIVTDSMGMEGITDNFLPADAAIYAIKAGVDIVLMPVVTQSLADVHNNLDPVIDAIETTAADDAELQARIEESARRIVQLKISRNLMSLDTTPVEDKDSAAEAIVGSSAHHDREREIADEAVTVVKNDANTLPIKPREGQKILLIGAYSNEPPALQFGLQQLIQEEKVPGVQISSMYYYNNRIRDADMKSAIAQADYVIAITETSSESALSPSSWITSNPRNIVQWSKEAGRPCVLVGIDKPYDAANYPDADTVLAVYGASGMDPTEGGVRPKTNYGPNIPAAVDVIFGAYEPTGTLPVNIPKIVDNEMSTTDIQYKRGYGITGSLTNVGKAAVKAPGNAKVGRDLTVSVSLSELQNLAQLGSTIQIAYDSANFTLKQQEGLTAKDSTISAALPSAADTRATTVAFTLQAKQNGSFQPIQSVTVKDENDRVFTPSLQNAQVAVSTESGGHSGSGSSGASVTPGTGNEAPPPEQTYISDTTLDMTVNRSYQFRITSRNGKVPDFAVGTSGVFRTELVRVAGDEYFFRIDAVGAPGQSAGIYVNGNRLLIATIGSNPSYVQLDTGRNLKVGAGKTYQFKVTAASKPSFGCGNGSVFRIIATGSKGNDYFFKVLAVGKAGDCAGFYVNGEKSPRTIGTVA